MLHAQINQVLERTEIRELSDTGCADARFLADSLLKATLDTLPIGIVRRGCRLYASFIRIQLRPEC